jgi:outer membrane protein assembly factor BamB
MTAVPSGQKLVEDLDQARLLWRSQQALGLPQGNFGHIYGKFKDDGDRLFYYTTCGGGASPIVGDGKVFATEWFPDGKEYDEEDIKKYQDFFAVKELHPAVKLNFSKTCHDWYVCMDAATGQTLWTSEFPEETGTYFSKLSPDHKTGPVGAAPCYANGKLFGLHLSGYLRAMDAKTGKLLWKQKIAGTEPQGRGNCHNVMFIGGVVMTGNFGSELYACDPETGAVLWKAPCDWVTDPQRWVHAGKEYAIVKGGSSPDGVEYRCLEPKTGKVLWSFRGFIFAECFAGISGDTIAVVQGKDGQDDPGGPGSGKEGRLSIAAYRLTPEKAEKIWEVPTVPIEGRAAVVVLEKYVAAMGLRKSRLLDLATGKEVATVDVGGPVNFGHVQVAEDRLFVRPDGAHGGININMLGATPETFKVMGTYQYGWQPKIPHSSSYARKMHTMPIVDGRMYIRGADGIYCYDLRKAAP